MRGNGSRHPARGAGASGRDGRAGRPRGSRGASPRTRGDRGRGRPGGEPVGGDDAPLDVDRSFEPTFEDLAPVPGDALELTGAGGHDGCVPGRVVRLDRGFPLVVCPRGAYRAEHAISLVKGDDGRRACVGDWVALRIPDAHDKALIEAIAPRRGVLSRWDGRGRGQRQTLAANLDLVCVVQPLSKRGPAVDRVARSAVLAAQGGIGLAVVLTKADRVDDDAIVRARACIAECLGDVACVVTSSRAGRGVDEVRGLVAPGSTALFLGESGAGKSSLVNALLGAEVLGTSSVRARDDSGRHTTVARRMLKVPGAGVVVDAPGLRSLRLLDEYEGLARAFPDVSALVPSCRFRDCTHGGEPGCAVRPAVESGHIPAARLEQYRSLVAEMRANRLGLDRSAPQSITA
jgi:ribosome biogenesis GTPase